MTQNQRQSISRHHGLLFTLMEMLGYQTIRKNPEGTGPVFLSGGGFGLDQPRMFKPNKKEEIRLLSEGLTSEQTCLDFYCNPSALKAANTSRRSEAPIVASKTTTKWRHLSRYHLFLK